MTSEERRRRDKYLARKRRRKRRRTIQIAKRAAIVGFGIFLIVFGVTRIFQKDSAPDEVQAKKEAPKTVQKEKEEQKGFQQKVIAQTPEFKVDLLTPNPYSRPQTAIEAVKGIVVHYTANPGTTAAQNRSYFESLKDTQKTKASSHFVVGLEGEVIQCIPSTEMSYASNDRNVDTLSIECCHMDETGQFTQETYDSLVELTAWLCGKFNLPVEDVIRHYDVTGKECPIYYVKNEDAWTRFKEDVQKYLDTYGTEPEK
ncbi:MAG: N-acetylmuramoyl-L-alanine amidase [Lachnospiraceae bacterium]|nr:N-acetylmuramoyl-L-alanine amidase [Lachnospiraceae bacterium]MCI8874059.1 N-acetylmuramoyl-L-alanine amidase [Lachnospiraceae bacterium]